MIAAHSCSPAECTMDAGWPTCHCVNIGPGNSCHSYPHG